MVKLVARTRIDSEANSINRDIGRKAAAISGDQRWIPLGAYFTRLPWRYGRMIREAQARSSFQRERERERNARSTAPRCAISRYARCDRVALSDFDFPSVCRRWVASNKVRATRTQVSTHARTNARSRGWATMAKGTSRRCRRQHRRMRPRRNCTRRMRTSISRVRKPHARGKRDNCRPDALGCTPIQRTSSSRTITCAPS